VGTARVVLIGIGLWAVALVVLLVLGSRVDRSWTWTCVAAIALGFLGLGVMRLQGQLGPSVTYWSGRPSGARAERARRGGKGGPFNR
jgi:hypothetical protein